MHRPLGSTSSQITLLERQELQQRVKQFCSNRGPPEHWLHSGTFKRAELQKALGNHLSWRERYVFLVKHLVIQT